jgi:hypothetical protein
MAALPLRERGFDPVVEGPRLLERVAIATAAPGTVVTIGPFALAVRPWRLGPVSALLLSVLDSDVTVRVLGPGAETVAEYLRFNSGARSAPLEEADFVLVTGSTSGGQVSRARRATSVRPSVVVAYAPDLLAAAGHSAPVTLVVDVPNAAPRRFGVAGIAAEEFDDVLNGTEPGAICAWLAAGDGTLAVLPASARWRRED